MAGELAAARAAKLSMSLTADTTGGQVSALYRKIVGTEPSPEKISEFVKAALPVVRAGARSAASLARTHHRQARKSAGVKGALKFPAAPEFVPEKVESSLRYVGFVAPAKKAEADLDAPFRTPDPESTYTAVDNSAARSVIQSGIDMARAAAEADKTALGWARVTQGVDACYFCSMLESRGMVYSTDSFLVSDMRFDENSLPPTVLSGELVAKVHDHCRCVLTPVFSRGSDVQANADRIYKIWKQVQRDFAWLRQETGADMIQIWRWYWEGSLPLVAQKYA